MLLLSHLFLSQRKHPEVIAFVPRLAKAVREASSTGLDDLELQLQTMKATLARIPTYVSNCLDALESLHHEGSDSFDEIGDVLDRFTTQLCTFHERGEPEVRTMLLKLKGTHESVRKDVVVYLGEKSHVSSKEVSTAGGVRVKTFCDLLLSH